MRPAAGERAETRPRACGLRLLLVPCLLLLAACGGQGGSVRIVDLRPGAEGGAGLGLRLELPAQVLRGLARGVPLGLRCELETVGGDRLSLYRELRFLPLSRQYQLREPASGYSRTYASRSAALAALEYWPLPQALAPRRLRVYLDRGRLPSPLALAAVFDRVWHLDSGEVTWPPAPR